MAFDFIADAFGLAAGVGLALHWLEVAALVVGGNLRVVKDFGAAHLVVAALELHLLEFLLHLLLHAVEPALLALHRAHAGVVVELLQTLVVVPMFAFFALHRVNQDSLA